MDIEKEFNSKEIDILIEAVDAWINKDEVGNIMNDLMCSILTPPDASEDLKSKINGKMEKDKS